MVAVAVRCVARFKMRRFSFSTARLLAYEKCNCPRKTMLPIKRRVADVDSGCDIGFWLRIHLFETSYNVIVARLHERKRVLPPRFRRRCVYIVRILLLLRALARVRVRVRVRVAACCLLLPTGCPTHCEMDAIYCIRSWIASRRSF